MQVYNCTVTQWQEWDFWGEGQGVCKGYTQIYIKDHTGTEEVKFA